MPIAWNRGPIDNLEKELEKAKETTDWFSAIILTTTQLERYGYLKIKEYLERKK